MRLVGYIDHFEGVYKPVELLEYLTDDAVVSSGDDSHTGYFVVFGFTDGYAFKVESPRAEHGGNPVERTEFIFNQY